ncbi:DUF3108 domain-containing protein [Taibaiella koreensis]|uniref:DUF3108 domain-containing protein n=1 Tax=Taibaiella koreensis TaxID=1268548 RepID=UPI000E59DAAE|nr:hypothetical protein [Taibaiella koreensis]
MKALTIILFMIGVAAGHAQTNLLPDGRIFDAKRLKNEKYQMDCYLVAGDQRTKFGVFDVEVKVNASTLSVFTHIYVPDSRATYVDTCIADVVNLSPKYRSSYSYRRNYALNFGNEISGYYLDKATGKRTTVKEPVNKNAFDSYIYSYVLGTLPLAPAFKATLSAYEYTPENKKRVNSVNINSVEDAVFQSNVLGARNVWKVDVVEEATNDKSSYYIDKESHKLWMVSFTANGNRMEYVDNELKLGNGSISGQVFARDNQNEGLGKGIAILNINKKQYAPVGTAVYLIPGTPYFEKFREDLKQQKKSKSAARVEPLSDEFLMTIRSTTVVDDKGNYEIKNVPEGTYYLVVSFGYEHTHIGTETVGQTDHYINGNYQGSSPINRIYAAGQNASANIEKKIKVAPGQKLEQDLKKTL